MREIYEYFPAVIHADPLQPAFYALQSAQTLRRSQNVYTKLFGASRRRQRVIYVMFPIASLLAR